MCSILKYVVLSKIDQNNWLVTPHSAIPVLGEPAKKEYRSHFKVTIKNQNLTNTLYICISLTKIKTGKLLWLLKKTVS